MNGSGNQFGPLTYLDSGFNGFFSRSIAANPQAVALTTRQPANYGGHYSQHINYDSAQTSGALGDSFSVGKYVKIDGKTGRVSVFDDQGNEIARIGTLEDNA